MKVQVLVRLKPGVLDVQGKAVEKGLHDIGFQDVGNMRVGKLIEFDIGDANSTNLEEKVREMCNKLLVNTVIENFEIKPV